MNRFTKCNVDELTYGLTKINFFADKTKQSVLSYFTMFLFISFVKPFFVLKKENTVITKLLQYLEDFCDMEKLKSSTFYLTREKIMKKYKRDGLHFMENYILSAISMFPLCPDLDDEYYIRLFDKYIIPEIIDYEKMMFGEKEFDKFYQSFLSTTPPKENILCFLSFMDMGCQNVKFRLAMLTRMLSHIDVNFYYETKYSYPDIPENVPYFLHYGKLILEEFITHQDEAFLELLIDRVKRYIQQNMSADVNFNCVHSAIVLLFKGE